MTTTLASTPTTRPDTDCPVGVEPGADSRVDSSGVDSTWAVAQLVFSPRLRQRRFQLLPLRGPSSPFTDVQGRQPSDSTAPAALSDLISSISVVGILQPVLVEEITQPDGAPPAMKLASGERRLRAARWGAVHMPDNKHFDALPAVICPGPLSDEERRIWQLIENLARESLKPGELAAALILHRCAVLLGKLLAAGKPVPAEIYAVDDPIARFRALDRLRGADSTCAAPWSEVLTRLGLQLSPRKARDLVAAFGAMPREISQEMDEAKISLHARIKFAELRRGHTAAAEGIWAAVRNRGRTELLTAAISVATQQPATIDANDAVTAAERLHEQANTARANKLRKSPGASPHRDTTATTTATTTVMTAAVTTAPGGRSPAVASTVASTARATYGDGASAASDPTAPHREELEGDPVDPGSVANALTALRTVLAAVSRGQVLNRHDRASLRLLTDQITNPPDHIDNHQLSIKDVQ